jgi:hypothetical protein
LLNTAIVIILIIPATNICYCYQITYYCIFIMVRFPLASFICTVMRQCSSTMWSCNLQGEVMTLGFRT